MKPQMNADERGSAATGETVPCTVCSEETPVERALIVRQWVFCEDCVMEIWERVVTLLRRKYVAEVRRPTADPSLRSG